MEAKKPKIILTGGHLSPLLAVYEELVKKAECVVVGRKHTFEADQTVSFEYQLLKEKNVKFYDISASRFQRRFTKHTLPSLLKFPRSMSQAFNILKKENPNAVLTFGGYVGFPIALTARLLGIPVVVHEQTLHAGLTNQLIGKIAAKICISYPSSQEYFPTNKTILTGNPLRQEIFIPNKGFNIPSSSPVLFVTGGSTGAHQLNTYIEFLLEKLLEKFVIINQTGDARQFKDYARLESLKKKLPKELSSKYILKKFIIPEEIGWIYKNADVVVSRAGANTVSELLALKKKAILIPLSHGQNNEQLENAKFYESSGLGEYILEKDVNLENLYNKIEQLLKKKVSSSFREFYEKDAAKEVAGIVLSVAKYV